MDTKILINFLNKEVAIRKLDGFTLIGILQDVSDSHILLTNQEYGDRVLMVSEITEIEERRVNQ